MTKKEVRYRIQEAYDNMLSDLRNKAVQEFQEPLNVPTKEDAEQVHPDEIIKVIEELFPNIHSETLLFHIQQKMGTFINMGKYYKAESNNGRRDILDSILLVMAEVYIDLKPYEIVIRLMYPQFNNFLDTLHIWYKDNKDRMYDNRAALYDGIINA